MSCTGKGQISDAGCSGPSCCVCPENFYQGGFSDNWDCQACGQYGTSPKGSQSASGCVYTCPANMYDSGSGQGCTDCYPGQTSPPGSTSFSACVCPSNTYYDFNSYISGSTACKACPSGTSSSEGSTGVSDCHCPVSTYGTSQSGCIDPSKKSIDSNLLKHSRYLI